MAQKPRASTSITFGDKLAFSSDKNASYNVSDDKLSFSIQFDAPPAAAVGHVNFAGVPKTKSPLATHAYTAVIPASGRNVNATFFVNGFGTAEAGTNTLLLFKVNGRHRVGRFTPKQDGQDFVASVPYRARSVTDIRISLVLIAERDASHPEAAALIAVNDITADTKVHHKPPPNK